MRAPSRVMSQLTRLREAARRPGAGRASVEQAPTSGGARTIRFDRAGNLRGAAALPGKTGGRLVAVVSHPSCRGSVRRWLRQLGEDQVTILSVGADSTLTWDLGAAKVELIQVTSPPDLLEAVQALGALDLVLTVIPTRLLPGGGDHLDLFLRLFLYLRPGGAYLLDRTVEDDNGLWPDWWQRVMDRAEPGGSRTDSERRRSIVAASIATVAVSRDLLIASNAKRHLYKAGESDVDSLLGAREPDLGVTVLERRPGGSFVPRHQERSYGPRLGEPWPDRIEYPELTLRHYEGKVASAGGMLLFADHTVLPDSFRWPHAQSTSKRLRSTGELAQIKRKNIPKRTLRGSYYFLDCAFSGHFGHLTSEVVSRLWGWEQAKREFPELKAYFYVSPGPRGGGGRLERQLFTAYGIAPDDLVSVREPKFLQHVVSASPMWQDRKPHYVHPDLRETWTRLSRGLPGGPPAGESRPDLRLPWQ